MATYVYECPVHGRQEIVKPMALAGRKERCGECAVRLRRIYTGQGFIVRPSGWHLRPGDAGYSDFNRELELGEVRQGIMEPRWRPVEEAPEPVRVLPKPDDRALQEIHEFGRVFDNAVRERTDLPEVLEG